MRNVVVSNLISLDGFMAGPEGEIDWFTGIADREFEDYAIDLINSVDAMLFGRVTYQLMESYWPTASPEADDPRIIRAMNEYPKIVFSRTLKSLGWTNASLAVRDPVAEVRELKRQKGRDMVIYGSGSIVSTLARAGLVDDYRILIAPTVLGRGIPLFRDLAGSLHLKMQETRAFRSGMVLLRYRPVSE